MEVTVIEAEKRKPNRERGVAITFRVSEDERALIERRMEQSGVKNLRAYMVKMAIDGHVVHIELEGIREMTRLLSNATNNLNQIARRVNQDGNLYAADIEDLREKYDSLWAQAKKILREMNSAG
jgi:uncharacterized protein (DUF1778 family)